ncbi:MAG: KH domain-containing protein [Candidatus Woesearchaeota archaeon]
MEYSYELKIPKERVAVLIGTDGEVKKEIEEATKSDLTIDSKEGDISIRGDDSLGLFTAKNVIKAVGRGFNPDIALLLLKQDYSFELLRIDDYAGKSKNKLLRLKGRVIGAEGKSRKVIENLTETNISVYGKTLGIIGRAENVEIARTAIEKLLKGAQHASVYRWLERKRKDLKTSALDSVQTV